MEKKALRPTKAKLHKTEERLGYSLAFRDTSPSLSLGSRAEKYWRENNFRAFYLQLRPGILLPTKFAGQNITPHIQKTFGIREIGFGNWVTIEDRYNYVNALYVALYDFRRVVGFQNLGMNALSITFGARGQGRAAAHYEPTNKIINITRYHRDEKTSLGKEKAFFFTGGLSSLAHEYAHFLDYFAGQYLDKSASTFAVSGGRSINSDSPNDNPAPGTLRNLMDRQLDALMWEVPGKKFTTFYKTLLKLLKEDDKLGEYFIRRNEIFARYFEVYTTYILGRSNVRNKLLAGNYKYYEQQAVYPPMHLVAKVAPLTEQFLKEFKKQADTYNLT